MRITRTLVLAVTTGLLSSLLPAAVDITNNTPCTILTVTIKQYIFTDGVLGNCPSWEAPVAYGATLTITDYSSSWQSPDQWGNPQNHSYEVRHEVQNTVSVSVPCQSVSISGATAVWRYQGPYAQPNEYTSLAGEVYPAPIVTLTTSISGGSATAYQWYITNGCDKIEFVGSTTSSSVQVRGIGASGQINDVTVGVIATINGQQVDDDYSLTVRQPTSVHEISSSLGGPPSGLAYGYTRNVVYQVRDQFGGPVPPGVSVDETVTECANPYGVGPLTAGDSWTITDGKFTDSVHLGRATPIPSYLCVKYNQTFKVGGSGVVKTRTMTKLATNATVQDGGCSPGSSCP